MVLLIIHFAYYVGIITCTNCTKKLRSNKWKIFLQTRRACLQNIFTV